MLKAMNIHLTLEPSAAMTQAMLDAGYDPNSIDVDDFVTFCKEHADELSVEDAAAALSAIDTVKIMVKAIGIVQSSISLIGEERARDISISAARMAIDDN